MAEAKRKAKSGKMTPRPKFRVVGDDDLMKPPELTPDERAYYRQLHRIIDDIYTRASNEYDMTWGQLAVNANLCYATVAKLGDRETKFPRHMTIFKLARAVGMELELQEPPTVAKKAARLAAAG